MLKPMLRSISSSLASFSTVLRFYIQTTSFRISACATHVPSLNPAFEFYRYHSSFSVFTRSCKARWSTEIMLSRKTPYGSRSETHFRNLSTANDSRVVGGDTEERRPESRPSYVADWSKHELLMTTCGGFWYHLPEGARVIASYIDTAASVNKVQRRQMPTALVVPSGMSDSVELKPLLDLMVKDGWRVVIPDVIGMKVCCFNIPLWS